MVLSIDDFKVTGTILLDVQNYCKMYSEFMEKVGRLMLTNLRKVALKWSITSLPISLGHWTGILQFVRPHMHRAFGRKGLLVGGACANLIKSKELRISTL